MSNKLDELKAQRQKLDAEIAAFEAEEKKKILVQVHELVKKGGLTAEDVFGHSRKPKRSGSASPAKYQHPQNPQLTWTGTGRKPGWIIEAIAGGATLESFRITEPAQT